MYTLSSDQITQVSGGCPICLATSACAFLGVSGIAVAFTTNQLFLFAAGGVVFTSSILYGIYHMQTSSSQ